MDQGIRGAAFQFLANRHFNRLVSKGPEPEASKQAVVAIKPAATVGIILSIGATPTPTETSEAKLPDGWRSKPMPADLLAKTTEQIITDGKDADVLKERPKSEDPTRLALTEQANQFALGKADNPFSGLSRQTLSSISYDDTGAYTTTEIAAAMQEMREDDEIFWTETYKRINDAEIKNGNQNDTQPMLLKAQLKLLSSMSKAELTTVDYSTESLSIELNDWELAGFKTPDPVEYPELLEPEATVLAATTDAKGKPVWKHFALSLLTADTTKLKLMSEVSSPDTATDEGAEGKPETGNWLQIYAQIQRL